MIIKYQKIIEKFSDGSSTTHDLNEPDYQDSDSRCTDTLPDQPAQINVEEVTLTPELKEQIKAASPHVRLSYKRLQERIRSRYSLEDEQYLTRISIGALSGTYAMQEDEPALIAAYQAWVEECREVARLERAGWGL